MPHTIDTSDQIERWRWPCPNGHTSSWWATPTHIWCSRCAKNGLDDTHEYLIDKQNDEHVPVRALDITGTYATS